MYKDRLKEDLFDKTLTNYLRLKVNNPYEYLKEKIKRGRVFFYGSNNSKVSENYWKNMEPIIRAMNEVYGDNWDILYYYTLYRGKILIHFKGLMTRFPQVTIENSNGDKFDGIKDLFVYYRFGKANEDIPYCEAICGGRTTMTFKEYYSYGHSHYENLPYQNFMGNNNQVLDSVYFSKFCLGSSKLATDIMETDESINNNEEFWTNFFVQMFTIIYYESLSGIPYKKMANMHLPILNSNYHKAYFERRVSDLVFLKNIFGDFKEKGLHLDIFLNDDKLLVDLDSKFEKHVIEAISTEMSGVSKYYLCYKIEGNRDELSIINNFNVSYNDYLPPESAIIIPIVYKQKEYPLVITEIPEDRNSTFVPEKMLMQETKRYLKELLRLKLSEVQKNEAFNSINKNKTSNHKRSLQRDNISLQENK